MQNSNFLFSGISEISKQIEQKLLSPVELINKCLEKIEQLNPQLNAFITVLSEQALAEAKIAEDEINKSKYLGPLHGIPVAIKDMYDTAGIKTTAAFEHFQNRIPAKDAVIVKKLKEAGAIIIGKTNMHTLAMGTTSHESFYGSVNNPWNPDYISGGSSGGSAVAIATGMCFATIDTDAIGSCRLPAACCGVTGFKPTYGLIDNKGILDGEPVDGMVLLLAHAAFMCRSAEDSAILLNALTDKNIPISDINPTIGIVNNFQASDSVHKNFQQVIDKIVSLGYSTVEVNAPMNPSFNIKPTKEERSEVSENIFKEIDLLILPTLSDGVITLAEAREKGPMALSSDNTFFCNYYGLPAISIPSGFGENGLPLGFQIVGPANREDRVLGMAARFQSETDWHLNHPEI